MRYLITNELEKCVGCNRCVRVCPIEEANIARENGGKITVEIDRDKCNACGACLAACHHGARQYEDDTERFFKDLEHGAQISVMTAPAAKTNFDDFGCLIAWLRQLGVRRVYDVSLGADICVWAHIRYMQRYGVRPMITQPCPSIVSYILHHRNELVGYLSPVHSPMCSLAVYMRNYEKIDTKIAAISPCVAKTYEFESTGLVDYNVTIKKLYEYIEKNNIVFPSARSGFDNMRSGLGSLFPMPGGLKENVEHYLQKAIRIDECEGPSLIYKALDEYANQPESRLPALFDVLNCQEGCNKGTGTKEGRSIFEINSGMDRGRQSAISEEHRHYLDDLYKAFDETLNLRDFLRSYTATPSHQIRITQDDVDRAFEALGKHDDKAMKFNCGACGCDTCREMAIKIAKGINTPQNCSEKAKQDVQREQAESAALQTMNLDNIESILSDTTRTKELMENIVSNIDEITDAISVYNSMIRDIEKIAMQVTIIALNASIEAARAGRHGKAFSVVAEEIRALAQNSSNSAQQTNEASEKATDAISSVNEMIMKISENVNASYANISEISENTKKMLKH